MKKIALLVMFSLVISGCATYKYQKTQAATGEGYIVLRDGRFIPEYTVGQAKSYPVELAAAKKRFARRKATVEKYYKKMGDIESRMKEMFLNPPKAIIGFMGGFFRLPFIAARNSKYENDPVYRQKVDAKEEAELAAEKQSRLKIKDQLAAYVETDLEKAEGLAPLAKQAPVVQAAPIQQEPEKKVVQAEVKEAVSQPVASSVVQPAEKKEEVKVASQAAVAEAKKEAPPAEKIVKQPKAKVPKPKKISKTPEAPVKLTAVITAKPQKGSSPLTVHFSAGNSSSSAGRITAFEWDFGDGDSSTRKNPVNTFWSSVYGTRTFTVTLTVTNDRGINATSQANIEVTNK